MTDVSTDITTLSGAEISAMTPQEASAALARFEAASRGPPPSEQPTDAKGAQARLDHLTNDRAFRVKLLSGDIESQKHFDDLTRMVAASKVDLAMAGIIPDNETTTSENPIATRVLATVATSLREQGLNEACIKEALGGAREKAVIYREALNRRAARMSDPEWTAKLLAGDFAANREFTLLSIVLAGEVVAG